MIDYGLGELQSTGYYIPAMAWYDNSNIIISYNIDIFKKGLEDIWANARASQAKNSIENGMWERAWNKQQ